MGQGRLTLSFRWNTIITGVGLGYGLGNVCKGVDGGGLSRGGGGGVCFVFSPYVPK